jgi:predicted porin
LTPKLKVFGRAEVGYNLLSNLSSISNSKDSAPEGKAGDNFFERLLYVGFEAPGYFLTAGKNWSIYYKVAGFTDRFSGTGGDAPGTYNAGTDGGATGTGRAQGVHRWRAGSRLHQRTRRSGGESLLARHYSGTYKCPARGIVP